MSLALTSRRAALLPGRWVSNELWRRARAVPSLDLRFAENKSLVDSVSGQSLITFTRASGGTYVGSDGLIKNSVVNLLTYSEEFDNASWVRERLSSINANSATAVDGTQSADELVVDTNFFYHGAYSNIVASTNATYTASVYLKAGTSNYAFFGLTDLATGVAERRINLLTGEVDTTNIGGSGSWTAISSTVTTIGSGWYRLTVTATQGGGTGVALEVLVGNSSGQRSYFANNTDSVLVWGAQLEASDTAGEYVKTTSSINGAPRFDHDPVTGESLGLLIEEQRTNLLLRSEEFDDASWAGVGTLPFGSGSVANATVAPDGTLTADKVVEDTAISAEHIIYRGSLGLSSSLYTFSVYAKAAERSQLFLRLDAGGGQKNVSFDLSTGAVLAQSPGTSGSITSVGNGWYRCVNTLTTADTLTNAVFMLAEAGTSVYTGDGTSGIYLWGAQVEAGAFPTSYIPTTSAAVTRNADVASITGTNFSNFYRQDEGTFFVDHEDVAAGSFLFDAIGSTTAERQYVRYTASQYIHFVVDNSVQQAATYDNTGFGVTTAKNALAYALNDFSIRTNGGVAASSAADDASGTLPTLTAVYLGATSSATSFLNGHISRLTYFNSRLSNATLQAITQ